MRIAVCGLGKLGRPIARCFHEAGVEVTGLDTDLHKLVDLPFFATQSPKEAVERSDACLFVVPTPSNLDGSFNHDILIKAMNSIAEHAPSEYLYIVNSTVVPGFCNALIDRARYRCVAYKPEFVALGEVEKGLTNPDLFLCGANDKQIHNRVCGLYAKIWKNYPAIHQVTLLEAELAKISLNCAITTKISFANQVGMVARRLGADPQRVLSVVGSDRRIGHDCLLSGLPYGGPCFPRDSRMFRHVADSCGASAVLAAATDEINAEVLKKILVAIPTEGTIGILGMTYKVGTDVTEESAGTRLYKILRDRGRAVFTHDPTQNDWAPEHILGCPTLIIACPWPEYENLRIPAGTTLIDPWGAVHK